MAPTPLEKEVLVDEHGALVIYYPRFISEESAETLLHDLSGEVSWNLETDDFGLQDRLTSYMGDEGCTFTYVGLENPPGAWHPKLRGEVRELLGQAFTGCLLNNYKVGKGSIPWHSDDVRAHGESKCIATVSLGGPRPFQLKHNDEDLGRPIIERWLQPGSLLLMQGETQALWRHQLPLPQAPPGNAAECPDTVSKEIGNWKAPHRISLTFRSIVPGWEDQNRRGAAQ